jgi:hypothetical protein
VEQRFVEDLLMIPRLALVLVPMLCGSLSPTALAQSRPGSLEELTRASHIIFVGRVEELNAANLKAVTPTELTALVRVEELLDVPPSLVGLKGEVVTVELLQPRELTRGDQAVFFTNGIVFGEHLEVKEVGHLPAPSDRAKMRSDLAALRAGAKEETLKARLETSVAVVTGTVRRIRPLVQTGPKSEHAPDWAAALIAVESIEKGSLTRKTVTVYFPRSTDERWLRSPKFHSGEQGVWILHREGKYGLPTAAFTALNPTDFHPFAERRRIRQLLHRG